MRQTSIAAYHEIENNGLLSKRRCQVYDFIFKNGPVTCRETIKSISSLLGQNVTITYSSFSSRFSELERMGVLTVIGKKLDPDTKHEVMLWDVTSKLPIKLSKPNKIKCTRCNGTGIIATQESFDI